MGASNSTSSPRLLCSLRTRHPTTTTIPQRHETLQGRGEFRTASWRSQYLSQTRPATLNSSGWGSRICLPGSHGTTMLSYIQAPRQGEMTSDALKAPYPVPTGMLGLSPSAGELPKTLGSSQVSKHPQLATPPSHLCRQQVGPPGRPHP